MEQTGITIFHMVTFEPMYIGSISTKDKEPHGKRLYHIAEEVLRLREKYPATQVAIERGFSRYPTSTQVIFRVHGLVNYLYHDVEQTYYPPKTVKEIIVRGDATKKRVREVIENTYPNVKFENEDESDSFAVGLAYLIKKGFIKWDKNENSKVKKKKSKE